MSKDKLRVVSPDERLPTADREIVVHRETKTGEKYQDTFPVNSEVDETDDGKLVIKYIDEVDGEKVEVSTTYNYGEWTKTVERTKIK